MSTILKRLLCIPKLFKLDGLCIVNRRHRAIWKKQVRVSSMDKLNNTFPVIIHESQLLSSTTKSLEKIYDEIKRKHTHYYYTTTCKIVKGLGAVYRQLEGITNNLLVNAVHAGRVSLKDAI